GTIDCNGIDTRVRIGAGNDLGEHLAGAVERSIQSATAGVTDYRELAIGGVVRGASPHYDSAGAINGNRPALGAGRGICPHLGKYVTGSIERGVEHAVSRVSGHREVFITGRIVRRS